MKMHSLTKAALALILCAVIAFSAAACSEPAGPGVSASDTAHGGSEPVPAVETEDPAYIADPGLVSLDYTGRIQFKTFIPSPVYETRTYTILIRP